MRLIAIVRTRFAALHHWPDAPDEVAYLRDPHRHTFHVTLAVSQTHADRDVEYLTLRRVLDGMIMARYEHGNVFGNLGTKSCEMIATEIVEWATMHGYHPRYCEVFEDGENGARVEVDA